MPRKATKKTSVKSERNSNGFLSQIKWGESYTSLFLGAVVVVVALVLIFSFFKARNTRMTQTDSDSTVTNEQTKQLPKEYTVKEGDNLWKVAENLYGSGYNWVDLASANKLSNPGVLFVGSKLSVPNVKPKTLTAQAQQTQNPIKGNTYTVAKGDYLWDISVRAYGDGFKWTSIAKANNIVNPNLIYAGTVLKLPR